MPRRPQRAKRAARRKTNKDEKHHGHHDGGFAEEKGDDFSIPVRNSSSTVCQHSCCSLF